MFGAIVSRVIQQYPNWDISVALRYLPLVKIIKNKFPPQSKLLEVGSGPFGIVPYLGDDFDVTGADVDKTESKTSLKKIYASADKLPFKTNSFPIVLSVDTLEHLPVVMREKSIFEMVRVSTSSVYLAFPSGRLSTMVDRIIANYYQLTHNQKLDFLDQHRTYGLPQESDVIKLIKSAAKSLNKKISVKSVGNTNIFLWLFLLLLGFSQIGFLTSIYHLLLLSLPVLQYFNFPPAYRRIILVEIYK